MPKYRPTTPPLMGKTLAEAFDRIEELEKGLTAKSSGYGGEGFGGYHGMGQGGKLPDFSFNKHIDYDAHMTSEEMVVIDLDGDVWALKEECTGYGSGVCSGWCASYQYTLRKLGTATQYQWTITRQLTPNGSCTAGDWDEPGKFVDFAVGGDDHLYWLGELSYGDSRVYDLGDMDSLTPGSPTQKFANSSIDPVYIAATPDDPATICLYAYNSTDLVVKVTGATTYTGYIPLGYCDDFCFATDQKSMMVYGWINPPSQTLFSDLYRCRMTGDMECDLLTGYRVTISYGMPCRLTYDHSISKTCLVVRRTQNTELYFYALNVI